MRCYDVAICDDSLRDRSDLRQYIEANSGRDYLLRFHEYESGEGLLAGMKDIRFSLVFLDIQMSGMDGEKTAELFRRENNTAVLVFVTGYAEPSPRSFEVQPYRYIKKGMPEQQKIKYIQESLREMMFTEERPIVEAKTKGRRLCLALEDIIYIEKYKKTTRAYLTEGAREKYELEDECVVRIPEKLEKIYSNLKAYGFGCSHSSYIVNFQFLISCTETEFKMEGSPDICFKIARSKLAEFNQLRYQFMISKYEERCGE